MQKKKKKKNLENLGFIPAILDKVVWLFGTYNGTFYILNFITSSLHIFNKYNIFQLMANKYLLIHVYIDTQAHTQICNCIHTLIEIDTYIYVCVCIYIYNIYNIYIIYIVLKIHLFRNIFGFLSVKKAKYFTKCVFKTVFCLFKTLLNGFQIDIIYIYIYICILCTYI